MAVSKKDVFLKRKLFASKLKYSISNSCVEFDAYHDKDGYPHFQFRINGKKKSIGAHRAAYMIANNEELSSNDVIMHTCDNPKCVNPKHLIKGSHIDNVTDKVLKGRQAKGSRNGRAKLIESQVIEIFKSTEKNFILADRYCVDRKVISNIKRGKTWKYLTESIS